MQHRLSYKKTCVEFDHSCFSNQSIEETIEFTSSDVTGFPGALIEFSEQAAWLFTSHIIELGVIPGCYIRFIVGS